MLPCIFTKYSNSVDPDQTAPTGAVWSGSTLFVSLSVLLNHIKGSKTDLLNSYVNYGTESKYIY